MRSPLRKAEGGLGIRSGPIRPTRKKTTPGLLAYNDGMDGSGLLRRRGRRSRPGPAPGTVFLLLILAAAAPLTSGASALRGPDVAPLLREIRDEVLGLERYPGEDFARGEFFLGEGDDDTYKTHAVGILVKEEAEGSRMTIVVSRLEPARDNSRVKYAREPRTIACRFTGSAAEIVRSDYTPAELGKLLPLVLKAVVDKKALLKRSASPRYAGRDYFPLMMAMRVSSARGSSHSPSQNTAFLRTRGSGWVLASLISGSTP